ncbi:ATP-binding cassette domain-containing protein [Amaricoccus solimangrovi]|uniref:ATP-binding cassette domain-containing protein n=1 Tax=Amaricoccus solimangrovi TaxID=2589815 RepID=A0A501WNX4_9RHOB|nr:ATP-binding cassette domain-containing protein [Amaricoccus solimangrovi]TPE49894.1 ATP-binding cassette domain-containing protein [Amaricoccus solimangrovi]
MIRVLLPLSRGTRGRLALGLLLAAATLLAGVGLIGLSGWFITATGLAGASVATALAFDVFAPAAAIRLLAILRTGARYGERLTTHDAALASLAALRERLFRGMVRGDAAPDLVRGPSRRLFRLTLDVDALDAVYLRGIVPAAALGCAAGAVGLGLGLMDARAGVAVALALLGLGLGFPALALVRGRRPARDRARLLETLRAGAADLAHGQTDLLMAGRLGAARARLAAADARLARTDAALDRLERRTGAGLALGQAGLLAGTLLIVAALAERGAIGAPVAALGLLGVFAATEPFAALRRAGGDLARARLAAQRLGPGLAPRAPVPAPATPGPGLAVALRGVAVRHPGAAAPVLDGIDLSIAEGERVAVVGASGAGKSTLIALLSGALAPEGGAAAALPATPLGQRTELFRDSLRGNLALAAPGASDARLLGALDAAGLGSFVAGLAEGLGTELGEGGLGLSGGQGRRLALARALLHDRPLWLLDEPTDGLDAATAARVLGRLDRAAKGRTLLIATHIRREAALAHRIVALSGGRIVADAARGQPAFDSLLAGLRPD